MGGPQVPETRGEDGAFPTDASCHGEVVAEAAAPTQLLEMIEHRQQVVYPLGLPQANEAQGEDGAKPTNADDTMR